MSEKGEKGSKSIQTRRETAAEASVALVGCKKVSAAELAVLTWYVLFGEMCAAVTCTKVNSWAVRRIWDGELLC